jgi:hypothetical protein
MGLRTHYKIVPSQKKIAEVGLRGRCGFICGLLLWWKLCPEWTQECSDKQEVGSQNDAGDRHRLLLPVTLQEQSAVCKFSTTCPKTLFWFTPFGDYTPSIFMSFVAQNQMIFGRVSGDPNTQPVEIARPTVVSHNRAPGEFADPLVPVRSMRQQDPTKHTVTFANSALRANMENIYGKRDFLA